MQDKSPSRRMNSNSALSSGFPAFFCSCEGSRVTQPDDLQPTSQHSSKAFFFCGTLSEQAGHMTPIAWEFYRQSPVLEELPFSSKNHLSDTHNFYCWMNPPFLQLHTHQLPQHSGIPRPSSQLICVYRT